MAQFDTFKWGDGTKYGASPTENFLYWTFIVDWDADGYYTGENEADTRMVGFSLARGRDYYVKPSGDGLEHVQPGRAIAVFDNEDGRYDPFNMDSPLYPYVTPGKFVRIEVLDANTGINYPVMRGVIEDIQPISGRNRVAITVVDGLQWLKDREVNIGLLQSLPISDPDVASALDKIRTEVDWPLSEWYVDYGGSVETLSYWWSWQQSALDAIHQLEDAEMGVFFVDRYGQMVFRGRHYQGTSVMTITEDEVLREISLPQPWEVVRNRVQVYSYPKVKETDLNVNLWELGDVTPIGIGETITVYAEFKYNNVPVAGGDVAFSYAVNTLADGTGADITAQCVHTYGDIGAGVILTLTNNSGQTGYVTSWTAGGLYVDAIYAPTTSILKDEDATSIAMYGPRVLTIKTPWQESTQIARDYATWTVSFLKDPKYFPTIQVEDRPDIQYGLELYDRVTLDFPAIGVSGDYRVAKIEHQWLNENGRAVRTTFKFEPFVDLSGYWQFTTQLGVSSVFGF